jgi:hypothetical protein
MQIMGPKDQVLGRSNHQTCYCGSRYAKLDDQLDLPIPDPVLPIDKRNNTRRDAKAYYLSLYRDHASPVFPEYQSPFN